MKQNSNHSFSHIKIFVGIGLIIIISLISFYLITSNSNTTPDSTKQLVAVNLATSYLHRLQEEQSITEPTYFEDRLTINDKLYKIEVMAVTTEHPYTLSITVNAFSAEHEFKGVAEGYVEVRYAQNEI